MAGVRGHAPAGWPPEVPPPDAPGWERRAVAWLYDLCPPDHRGYVVLQKYPVLLARVARQHVASAAHACRRGAQTARADIRELDPGIPPEAVDALLGMYEGEALRLEVAARGAHLVERALAGQRFTPRL
jgi:hypothetical protein